MSHNQVKRLPEDIFDPFPKSAAISLLQNQLECCPQSLISRENYGVCRSLPPCVTKVHITTHTCLRKRPNYHLQTVVSICMPSSCKAFFRILAWVHRLGAFQSGIFLCASYGSSLDSSAYYVLAIRKRILYLWSPHSMHWFSRHITKMCVYAWSYSEREEDLYHTICNNCIAPSQMIFS